MKFQRISTVLIWSEDFRKLANWYQDVFGLKPIEEINHPNDTGVLHEFPDGGTWLWIGQHSEVKGKNENPHRIMFNINVDSVENAYQYLVKKGVKVFANPFKAPTFDKWFITLYDLDGNFVQVVGPR